MAEPVAQESRADLATDPSSLPLSPNEEQALLQQQWTQSRQARMSAARQYYRELEVWAARRRREERYKAAVLERVQELEDLRKLRSEQLQALLNWRESQVAWFGHASSRARAEQQAADLRKLCERTDRAARAVRERGRLLESLAIFRAEERGRKAQDAMLAERRGHVRSIEARRAARAAREGRARAKVYHDAEQAPSAMQEARAQRVNERGYVDFSTSRYHLQGSFVAPESPTTRSVPPMPAAPPSQRFPEIAPESRELRSSRDEAPRARAPQESHLDEEPTGTEQAVDLVARAASTMAREQLRAKDALSALRDERAAATAVAELEAEERLRKQAAARSGAAQHQKVDIPDAPSIASSDGDGDAYHRDLAARLDAFMRSSKDHE